MSFLGRTIAWVALLVLALAGTSDVFAAVGWGTPPERRVALVIGNQDYSPVEPLKNAVNDSTALADALRGLGFEVTERSNLTLARFRQALAEFEETAEGASTAMIYYSGHGFQLRGVNYLVPVDARLRGREAIEKETLRLDAIIEAFQSLDRQMLIFLDACRNNPLPPLIADKDGANGLARIETGSGAYVAFATMPGAVTHDGGGDHSPFAAALLQHIGTPGISVSDMMVNVRDTVVETTQGRQEPGDQSFLRRQFYFNPGDEAGARRTDEESEEIARRFGGGRL